MRPKNKTLFKKNFFNELHRSVLVDVSVQEEEKKGSRTPEEAMGGRRHWHSGHPFEQTREAVKERSLACCSPRGRRVGHN